MIEMRYQDLPANDRRYALRAAERDSGRRAFLLEKDIWVVATLRTLFEAPFAGHLTFKGGTSLSKAWHAIRRFSEDIDITHDIRALAPDLVVGGDDEGLPPTRSQERRWTKAIRTRLAEWVRDLACPIIGEGLAAAGFTARIRTEAHWLHVGYDPLFEESGFVLPEVKVDFGARSTGEPHGIMPVVCDAAAYLPDLAFPETRPTVMLAERTFWEKATAAHVFCRQERHRGERWSRHWHDLARLDMAGVATLALDDRPLALSVARHKAMFFSEKDSRGERIDYEAAVRGGLQLVPTGAAHAELADDHASMLASGMLLDDHEPFDAVMERCAGIQARANS